MRKSVRRIFSAALFAAVILTSCKSTQTITEYVYKHDTITRNETSFLHDTTSVYVVVKEDGDTIYKEVFKFRTHTDTLYVDKIVDNTRTETITIVDKSAARRAYLSLFIIVFAACSVFAVYGVLKKRT